MKDLLGAIFGVVLGLFSGLLIIGTLIRPLFSQLFGWGDSAPMWGVWTEAILIVAATMFITFHTVKWGTGKKAGQDEPT